MVVTADIRDEPAEEAPAAGAEVMMLPPAAIRTLASGEVVTMVEPRESVRVSTAAGASDEVVIVLPWEFVVVIATSTLVGATLSKADVVCTTKLPAESVDEISIGTNTPLTVPALNAALTVPPVIAAGVLTTVLPAASVVVTGGGVDAAIVDSATTEETIVLPAASVVVKGIVVPALLLPIKEDDEPCSDDITEPSEAVERAEDRTTVLSGTTKVLPSNVTVVDCTEVGPSVDWALDTSLVCPLPAAEVAGEVV